VSRIIFSLVVGALTAAALILPSQEPPTPGDVVAVDPPSVAVCPVEQGSGVDTIIGVVSTISGPGQFTAFAGGAPAGSASFATGVSGSAAIRVVDVAAVGVAAGLVELPNAEAAAGSLVRGAELVAQESCQASPALQTVLSGGFTTEGSEFELRLMNPYAGQATVNLTVRSESGIESASQLDGISVPSRSIVVVDMDELLPGRESLTVTVDSLAGSVVAVGNIRVGPEGAMWNAVAPAVDWFIPAPSGGLGQVVIATSSSADVEFQVDVYGTGGVVEAFQEGVVPARGEVRVDVDSAGVGASAFRVVSTEPVAVFLRRVDGSGVALTGGAAAPASRWLLPTAGATGNGKMVVLNAGIESSSVIVTALRGQSSAIEVPVPAGAVVEVPSFEGGAQAYTMRGEGLFVPMWVTSAGNATAYSLGVPLIDE
jgi:hypothetical protein